MPDHYVPKFSHKDWIDHQHRVQAGGEDGLNSRFHQLEAEFAGLAQNQINPIIEELGGAVQTRHLTLAPALFPDEDSPVWIQGVDMVEKPLLAAEAHGFMSIVLPDGVRVKSLLVTGNKSAGTLTVALKRRPIGNEGVGAEPLVTTNVLQTPENATGVVRIENESHRHFLTIDITGAANGTARVFCVQIAYE
ncbi:hypothetical protein HHL19_21785 [Streptomyces sp. R302]|uniref:hypothetical protein n=1 Tax=unclassified Streptomyces TaxID=2593676 RepID=UPI00145D819F|nr:MULTISPECIES: hypothetical protein [unclassified Streptomyces]NML51606.1 hypothetical protein [Streptomyces sp. R301]NML81226.1 hypothetical protein [Streptomyces sp. R302]